MYNQKVETLEPFSSHVIPMKTTKVYLGECINLWCKLCMLRMEPCHQASQYRIHTLNWGRAAKRQCWWCRITPPIPKLLGRRLPWQGQYLYYQYLNPPKPKSLQVEGDANSDLHTPKLMIRQRHSKLFDELDLSGLDTWALELADEACQLLAEYHDVFSLDPVELGCTHSTEHTIKVTDNTPFKEQFRWIPLPKVEEVRNQLREMLESGAIRSSQSAWCNAVMLVRKKDGSLHFCINFWHLNVHMKKDSYPLPRIQEALKSLVGNSHFSCLDLKSGFRQIKMDEASRQYITFTVSNLGFFGCNRMPFGLCNAPATF